MTVPGEGASCSDRARSGCSGFRQFSAGTLDTTKENELGFIAAMLKKRGDRGVAPARELQG